MPPRRGALEDAMVRCHRRCTGGTDGARSIVTVIGWNFVRLLKSAETSGFFRSGGVRAGEEIR
jgi:hypothetical protein